MKAASKNNDDIEVPSIPRKQKGKKEKVLLSYAHGGDAARREVLVTPGAHPIGGINSRNIVKKNSKNFRLSYSEALPAPERRENGEENREEIGESGSFKNVTHSEGNAYTDSGKSSKPVINVKNTIYKNEESPTLLEAELAPNVDEAVNIAIQQAMAERDQAIDLALRNMNNNIVTGTIVQAEKVDVNASCSFPKWFTILLVLLTTIAIILGLYFGFQGKNRTEAPSLPPISPLNRFESLKMTIAAVYNNNGEEQSLFPSSADQERALIWLANTDPKQLSVNSPPDVLFDRYFAAFLYFSLYGPNWIASKKSWMSEISTCFWEGLACNNQNLLSSVDLSNIGINGEIPTDFGLMTNLELLHMKNDQLKMDLSRKNERKSYLRNSSAIIKYNQNIQTRIAGGTITTVGEYPYFVNINDSCGASLIHEDLILSAAYCFDDGKRNTPVTIGFHESGKETKGVEYRSIIEGYVHPKYKLFNYDYSVMKLDKPVTTVSPVKLNRNPQIPLDDETVTMIGFGLTVENGKLSPFLRKANVNVVDHATCNKIYSFDINDDTAICVGLEEKGSCTGDGGGPLLTRSGVQVGVSSWSSGCGKSGFPNGYARVSGAIDWIDDIICKHSASPPKSCSTNNPSSAPTQEHSAIPTEKPSVIPTEAPSSTPSRSTTMPSSSPTQRLSFFPSQQSQPQLFGNIPKEIGSLTKLTSLDLSDNGMIGYIPTELGMLTKLTLLSLSNNNLTGSIPIGLQSMINNPVIDVRLDGNNLTN